MEQQISLMKAIELLRDDAPTAWEAVFHHTNARVYYICKTIFANREAILRAMRSFYVTLHDGLPPAKDLNDEAACQRALDIWLFNTCKRLLKEEDPRRFIIHADDEANAEKFLARAQEVSEAKKKTADRSEGGGIDKKWLLKIPPEQRLLVLMHDGSGMEPSEIAELLRVPENYVCGQCWAAACSAANHAALAHQLSLKGGAYAKLNDETITALLDSIRAALAVRASARRQVVPESAEAVVAEESAEGAHLDTARIVRIVGAGIAALAVLAFAAVAITMKSRGAADPLTSQSFDFADPYLSKLDDYAYSFTKITTTAPPIPPTYIFISQLPSVQGQEPTQPTQPPVTQPPVSHPPITQPPVTQPPVTHPPVTNPPTSTSTTSTKHIYTESPKWTTAPTQPPTTDEEVTVEENP